MKIVQSAHNFCRVEKRRGVVETTGTAEITEQLPTADVGEQHVEEALVLGAPAQVHQERMVNFLKLKSI